MRRLYTMVKKSKEDEKKNLTQYDEEEVVYSAREIDNGKKPNYQVVKREDGFFEIVGERVVRTKRLINLKTDEGIDRLLAYLDSIGIDQAIADAGAVNGDTIVLDGFEFDYFE